MASTETVTVGDDAAHGEVQTGTEVHGGAEHGTDVFPPFDSSTFPSQLLWLAITFVALYYLMARVALPRISGILENRRDRIASDIDLAERLKSESDEAIASYEAALADARAKAFSIAEEAREEARSAADAQRTKTEAELEGRLEKAEARIGEIKAEALREVGNIAGEATSAIVARLIDAEPSGADVAAAVADVMKGDANRAG